MRCSADSGFAYQSVGFGATTDGVYFPGAGGTGGIQLTTAWGIRGAFNHNWDPYWSSSLFGGYSSVRYDGGANDNLLGAGTTTAKGAYCAAFAASHAGQALAGNAAGNYTCNPDFNVSQLGVVTRWTYGLPKSPCKWRKGGNHRRADHSHRLQLAK